MEGKAHVATSAAGLPFGRNTASLPHPAFTLSFSFPYSLRLAVGGRRERDKERGKGMWMASAVLSSSLPHPLAKPLAAQGKGKAYGEGRRVETGEPQAT